MVTLVIHLLWEFKHPLDKAKDVIQRQETKDKLEEDIDIKKIKESPKKDTDKK